MGISNRTEERKEGLLFKRRLPESRQKLLTPTSPRIQEGLEHVFCQMKKAILLLKIVTSMKILQFLHLFHNQQQTLESIIQEDQCLII